ncbi:MAG TPA: hypothetical protein VGQ53_03665 [Chitinophagaceae bacterium]|jgi:hypothetical protein|nr:hypothetical protein [Chitinophagaceae bacterium]
MNTKFLYGTVTSAIKALRKAGFDKDFRLMGNDIGWNDTNMDINDLKIVTVSRYEGNSDPADEASVYGIESKSGLNGILITDDDANSEASSSHILKKLHVRLLNSGNVKEIY